MATKCWRCQGSGRIFDKVDGKYQQVPCPSASLMEPDAAWYWTALWVLEKVAQPAAIVGATLTFVYDRWRRRKE